MDSHLVPPNPTSHAGNNFDAIRLAMALLVVWSHSFAIYLGSEEREPISLLLKGAYNAGEIGVLVFFIISGFLISQSYNQSKTVPKYFARRIRRIYPGYMVATSVCAFIVIPIFSSHADFSATEVFKTLGLNLLLRNYFPSSDVFNGRTLNGSLWSIPFEFWCYIGLPLLGLFGLLTKRWPVAAIACLTILVRLLLDLIGHKPGGGMIGFVIGWPYLWVIVLPCFLAGASFYLYRDIIPRSGAIAAGGIALLICMANLPIEPLSRKCIVNLLFPVAVTYGILYVAFSPTVRLHNVARFGDFSYGTYLYAFTIQQALLFVFGTKLTFPVYIVTSMSLALIAGVVSWFSVERWFLVRGSVGSSAPHSETILHAHREAGQSHLQRNASL